MLVKLVTSKGHVLVNHNSKFVGLFSWLTDLLDIFDTLHVNLNCFLILTFLEMSITIIFVLLCKFQKLWITLLTCLAIFDLYKLHLENQRCASWNFGWTTCVAVAVIGLDMEFSLLAELHLADTNVPALDDLALAH